MGCLSKAQPQPMKQKGPAMPGWLIHMLNNMVDDGGQANRVWRQAPYRPMDVDMEEAPPLTHQGLPGEGNGVAAENATEEICPTFDQPGIAPFEPETVSPPVAHSWLEQRQGTPVMNGSWIQVRNFHSGELHSGKRNACSMSETENFRWPAQGLCKDSPRVAEDFAFALIERSSCGCFWLFVGACWYHIICFDFSFMAKPFIHFLKKYQGTNVRPQTNCRCSEGSTFWVGWPPKWPFSFLFWKVGTSSFTISKQRLFIW